MIAYINSNGTRAPRNEMAAHPEQFDASNLFHFPVPLKSGPSDLAFLLDRQASPVPVKVHQPAPKNPRKKPDFKTRAEHMADTRAMYLSALDGNEWRNRSEICKRLGKSPSSVTERMLMLVAAGYVECKKVNEYRATTIYYRLA